MPAVLATSEATRRLRNGDLVRVDGTTGDRVHHFKCVRLRGSRLDSAPIDRCTDCE
ncbi:MAG: hypothetical protein ACRDYB_05685 [Acidimicrobiales bacterium]